MLWAPLRDDWSIKSHARHDLLMMGLGSLSLKHDREPRGLSTGFTEESVQAAKEHIADLRRLNPNAVILGDLLFYDLFSDNTSHKHDWYPEYDVKIGQPEKPGKRMGPHSRTRSYTGGEIYVNLPGAVQGERVLGVA